MTYSWFFDIHPAYSLNFTFHFIYFSSVTINYCFFGSLSITYLKGNQQILSHFLCGIHPKFVLYLESEKTVFTVKYLGYVLHDTEAFFQIQNTDQLISVSKSGSRTLSSDFCPVYQFKRHKSTLQVFRISVARFRQLVLYTQNMEQAYVLHDGPGFLSAQHKFKNNVFVCSTFQCTLSHFGVNAVVNYTVSHKNMTCFTIEIGQNQTTIVNNQQLCGNYSQCLVQIFTSNISHVNASIISLNFTGQENTMDCLYGGLSFFENDTQHICPEHQPVGNQEKGTIKPAYSRDESLLLALYQYKEYGRFSFTFEISSTRCKILSLDPCEKDNVNVSNLFYTFFCHQINTRYFAVKREECLVLQLSMRKTPSYQLKPSVSDLSFLDFAFLYLFGDTLIVNQQYSKKELEDALVLIRMMTLDDDMRDLWEEILTSPSPDNLAAYAGFLSEVCPQMGPRRIKNFIDNFMLGENTYFLGCQLMFQLKEQTEGEGHINYQVRGFLQGIWRFSLTLPVSTFSFVVCCVSLRNINLNVWRENEFGVSLTGQFDNLLLHGKPEHFCSLEHERNTDNIKRHCNTPMKMKMHF